MKAKLIGESSAGMTAVEIYDNPGTLVWSHRWFDDGATGSGYIKGLCDAWDCMVDCADVDVFEGGAFDEDGDPIAFDDGATTGVMLEYDGDSKTWTIGDDARCLGQSMEIVDACMIAGLIPADDSHEDHVADDIVVAVAKHIASACAGT